MPFKEVRVNADKKSYESWIQAIEMKFLKTVKRYTREGRLRNYHIRVTLNIFGIHGKILIIKTNGDHDFAWDWKSAQIDEQELPQWEGDTAFMFLPPDYSRKTMNWINKILYLVIIKIRLYLLYYCLQLLYYLFLCSWTLRVLPCHALALTDCVSYTVHCVRIRDYAQAEISVFTRLYSGNDSRRQ